MTLRDIGSVVVAFDELGLQVINDGFLRGQLRLEKLFDKILRALPKLFEVLGSHLDFVGSENVSSDGCTALGVRVAVLIQLCVVDVNLTDYVFDRVFEIQLDVLVDVFAGFVLLRDFTQVHEILQVGGHRLQLEDLTVDLFEVLLLFLVDFYDFHLEFFCMLDRNLLSFPQFLLQNFVLAIL